MALYPVLNLPHSKGMGLRDGTTPDCDDLSLDEAMFPIDNGYLSEEAVDNVIHKTSSCKEPGHSILKCSAAHDGDDDLDLPRRDSDPVSVPCSGLNRKESGGMVESPSLMLLGTSPGTGSMADMWRLWADDDTDLSSEFLTVAPPARRSLSLKAKKTPPGTPSPKKMVRFADAMGLDLEKVRHFMQDQIPNTPAASTTDSVLPVATLTDDLNRHSSGRYLTPAFPQPCLAGNFLERIRTTKVCLDSVQTQDFAVHGLVRVLNVSFEKGVVVRYTFDNWRSVMDQVAQYVPNSNDNFSDRFQFTLNAPPYLNLGQQLQFALCYQANGEEYWDNNYGQNYCLTCCAGGTVGGLNPVPNSPLTNAFW